MKRRDMASPDIADAVAVTFAAEVATLPTSDWAGCGDHLVRREYDPGAVQSAEQYVALEDFARLRRG